MSEHDVRSADRKGLSRWVAEVALIVASVVLGFWVSQMGEARSNRQLAARALKSLQAEVEYNISSVEPWIPQHRAWINALQKAQGVSSTATGVDVFFATRPTAETNAPVLRRGAWDAALSTGALKLLDYELAAKLSEIYQMQTMFEHAEERLNLLDGPFFTATSRDAAVRQLWFTLTGIEYSEAKLLLPLYRRHLPAIRAAALTAR